MTPDEAAAIRFALLHETNPNHLIGFASALSPEHAVAASLLFARAQLIERRRELGTATTLRALDVLNRLASEASLEPPPAARALKQALDAYAHATRTDPATLGHAVVNAASDLLVNPAAAMPELPPVGQALAHALLAEIVPGIRLIHPMTDRLMRTLSALTPPGQHAERARWVRQYLEEARVGPANTRRD